MEYITAEQFLEQNEEVQNVFIDWWKPQMYDLTFKNYGMNKSNFLNGIHKGCIQDNETLRNARNRDLGYYPLLTEGQLRKFIEDKTDKTMTLNINIWKYKTLVIEISLKDMKFDIFFKAYGRVIDAYWKVALEIAKESVAND